MHPQTLRQYDRMGLVVPQRTQGRGRRYSADDVDRLRLIQRLSQEEGINLAGIKRILELHEQVRGVQARISVLTTQLNDQRERSTRVFAAGSSGDIVSMFGHARRRAPQALRSLPAAASPGFSAQR